MNNANLNGNPVCVERKRKHEREREKRRTKERERERENTYVRWPCLSQVRPTMHILILRRPTM